MEKEFNYDQTMCLMFIKLIDKYKELSDVEKATIFEMIYNCKDNITELTSLYARIIGKDFNISTSLIQHTYENGNHKLSYKDKSIVLDEDVINNLLINSMDLFEEILPLGTVVDLKKEVVRELVVNLENLKNVRVVITNRFLFDEEEKTYLNYAGVPYPTGFADMTKTIQFTSSAIEKVVKKSFEDTDEKAYICYVKNELIIKRGMHSFRFSTEEERERLKSRVSQ